MLFSSRVIKKVVPVVNFPQSILLKVPFISVSAQSYPFKGGILTWDRAFCLIFTCQIPKILEISPTSLDSVGLSFESCEGYDGKNESSGRVLFISAEFSGGKVRYRSVKCGPIRGFGEFSVLEMTQKVVPIGNLAKCRPTEATPRRR